MGVSGEAEKLFYRPQVTIQYNILNKWVDKVKQ